MHACPIDNNMKIDKYASCNLPTEDPISNLKAFNQDGYENVHNNMTSFCPTIVKDNLLSHNPATQTRKFRHVW